MKCNEFSECVCEIIDKRLSDEKTNELLEHAMVCPKCKFEFESLKTAKKIVQSKIQRESVPGDLYFSILNATVNASPISAVRKFFGMRLNPVVVFIVLALIGVGIYSIFSPSASSVPDDANIINQSINNYQAVIGGSIKPQLVSSHDNVRSFLEKEVNFAVNVPPMKGCTSCGGRLSIFKGVKLAHVVFNVGGSIVYIYQANLAEALKGDKIALPDDAKNELEKTDWYVKELPGNETIILWKYKNTLCAAVSKMGKQHLMALLTNSEQTQE